MPCIRFVVRRCQGRRSKELSSKTLEDTHCPLSLTSLHDISQWLRLILKHFPAHNSIILGLPSAGAFSGESRVRGRAHRGRIVVCRSGLLKHPNLTKNRQVGELETIIVVAQRARLSPWVCDIFFPPPSYFCFPFNCPPSTVASAIVGWYGSPVGQPRMPMT